MDPDDTPFNALIVGPTNSGKTQSLVNQLCGPFNGKFDYVVQICPTFAYNRTLYRFCARDPRLDVIICEQHQVEIWLKLVSFCFEGTNTLIVLDDCAASKEVKGRTGELVKLGFLARHAGISVLLLTQQLSSISKPFRENVAAIVLFHTPLSKAIKTIFEEYAGELSHEKNKANDNKVERPQVCPFDFFRCAILFPLKRSSTKVLWNETRAKKSRAGEKNRIKTDEKRAGENNTRKKPKIS